MRARSNKQKFLILVASLLVGISGYFGSYSIYESRLSPWQKRQAISFENNTGASKFEAHLKAATAGGIAFCISAIFISAYARIKGGK